MAKVIDMTKGSPAKLLVRFSVPLLIGNLFQQVYTLVDRVIVGQFVGADAFSAVGSTNALSMMFMSMCMGTAIGCTDRIRSRSDCGSGDRDMGNLADHRSYMAGYGGICPLEVS